MQAGRAAILAYTMPMGGFFSAVVVKRTHHGQASMALDFRIRGLFLLLWPDLRAVEAAPAGALFMLERPSGGRAGTVRSVLRWHMPATLVMGWQLLIGGIPGGLRRLPAGALSAIYHVS